MSNKEPTTHPASSLGAYASQVTDKATIHHRAMVKALELAPGQELNLHDTPGVGSDLERAQTDCLDRIAGALGVPVWMLHCQPISSDIEKFLEPLKQHNIEIKERLQGIAKVVGELLSEEEPLDLNDLCSAKTTRQWLDGDYLYMQTEDYPTTRTRVFGVVDGE